MAVPNIVGRYKRLIDLSLPPEPHVFKYRLKAHKNLVQSFSTGGSVLFEAIRGRRFQSPSVKKNLWGTIDELDRGHTRILFDPNDYKVNDPANLPGDKETMFLRVEKFDTATSTWLPAGPILIIPPPVVSGIKNYVLTIAGTAPSVGAVGVNPPTTGAMNFYLPLYTKSATISNTGGGDLYLSSNEGIPFAEIKSGASPIELASGSLSELLLGGTGTTFSIFVALEKV